MQIRLKKISDDQHELHISRKDGTEERVLCETKSLLAHDLLHFALESVARLKDGFWGMLAGDFSLDDLNDRSGKSVKGAAEQLMTIEAIVGPLQGLVHGISPRDIVSGLRSQGDGLGWKIPEWLNEQLLDNVARKFASLHGQWKATPFGSTMEITWSESISTSVKGT